MECEPRPACAATTIQTDEEMSKVNDLFSARHPWRITYHFEEGVVISDREWGVTFVPNNELLKSGEIEGAEEGESTPLRQLETLGKVER